MAADSSAVLCNRKVRVTYKSKLVKLYTPPTPTSAAVETLMTLSGNPASASKPQPPRGKPKASGGRTRSSQTRDTSSSSRQRSTSATKRSGKPAKKAKTGASAATRSASSTTGSRSKAVSRGGRSKKPPPTVDSDIDGSDALTEVEEEEEERLEDGFDPSQPSQVAEEDATPIEEVSQPEPEAPEVSHSCSAFLPSH